MAIKSAKKNRIKEKRMDIFRLLKIKLMLMLRRKEKVSQIIVLILTSILPLFVLGCLSYTMMEISPAFEKLLINIGKGWATAIIAIPLAFLGILSTIIVPVISKYNIRFMGEPLRRFYNRGAHPFDFSSLIFIGVGFYFVAWIICFAEGKDTKMVSCSLIMSILLIYLIVFYIWKYRLTPSEIFIKCNVKSKIMLLRIVSEAKMEESINEYINAKEFNESQSIIDKFDLEICSIINSLCLCVKNKNDNAEEKAAILGIFNELRKVMIGRVASMSALLIGQKILEAINISLEIKDDFFYKLLLDCFESMFYMRFQKNEKKINNYKLLISEISKSNISETQKQKEIEEIKKEMMIKEHIQNIKTRSLTFISEITNRANSSSEVDK